MSLINVINNLCYSEHVEKNILKHLDGWKIKENESLTDSDIDAFVNQKIEYNKLITSTECKLFYDESLNQALLTCNRTNVNDLTEVEFKAFQQAVCKLTASNLWNKYNIRITNEDMEDVHVSSYGGLLYSSAMKSLKPFIIQRIYGMHNG